MSDEEVARAFALVNDRPRKVLGYRTADEVYREMCTQLDNPPFEFV